MRLYYKINALAVTIIVLVALVIARAAVVYMDDLVETLNQECMRSSLHSLVQRARDNYQTLFEKGLDDSVTYTNLAQREVLHFFSHHRDTYGSRIEVYRLDGIPIPFENEPVAIGLAHQDLDTILENPNRMIRLRRDGKEYFVVSDTVPEWGWLITLSTESGKLFSWRNKFLLRSLLILPVCIVLGSLIFLVFSRRMVRPLQQLASNAKIIDTTGWRNNIAHITSNDEIGALSRAFSNMVENRLAVEEKLRESELQYRLLANNVHDVIWTMDTSLRFTYFSPSVTGLLGYTPDEILQLSPETYVPSEYIGLLKQSAGKLQKLWEQGRHNVIQVMEIPCTAKDDSIVWIEATYSPLVEEGGAVRGTVGVARDITKRKLLEFHKNNVDRLIRHDLKQPLAGVIALPEVVIMSGEVSERNRNILLMIQKAGNKMLHMIDASIGMYKLEAGSYIYNPQPIDLLDDLKTIEAELSVYSEPRDISVLLIVDGAPYEEGNKLEIMADKALFPFMISNLLKNAIEASPSREKVTVSIDSGGPLRISFHNKGTVPPSVRERFFDKYVTYGKKEGTGLGTYSAQTIARAHGGDVSMETSTEKGTLVTVVITP